MKKLKLEDAIEYVNRVAQDGLNVAVFWDFDKRLAFTGRSDFDGEHFVECLKVVMEKIGTGKVKRDVLTEGSVRRGGTKLKPFAPGPDIKPVGQKSAKYVLKRPIIYNDRIVGPQ